MSATLKGNSVLVGAGYAEVDGNAAQGAVYVFERETSDYLVYLPAAIR